MMKCMQHQADAFFDDTSIDLQWELTKAIVNHRTLSEYAKRTLLYQYYRNLITNGVVVDILNTEVQ